MEPGHVQRGPAEVWLRQLVHAEGMVAVQVVFVAGCGWQSGWWWMHHHPVTVQPWLGVDNVTGGGAEL